MHYLYADSLEYHRSIKSKFIPMTIEGIHVISFKRLDEAIAYKDENDGKFTFFEGDHPQVLKYWSYVRAFEEDIEADARKYRAMKQ